MRSFRFRLKGVSEAPENHKAVNWISALENEFSSLGLEKDDLDNFLAPVSQFLKSGRIEHLSSLPKKLANRLQSGSIELPKPPTIRVKASSIAKEFTFIDLFAGIGGFHLALASQGGTCVFSSEWDAAAQLTYFFNHGIVPYGDIRQFTSSNGEDLRSSAIRKLIPKADILSAGFPCQPFSLAGVSSRNHHGISHGLDCTTQGTLFHDIVLIAKSTQPKALLLENVRNLASHDSGRTIAVILKQIEDAGYVVFPQNFGSKNWAILDSQSVSGQRRKRVYLVCIRKDIVRERGAFEFPVLSLSKSPITLRQVIEQDSTLTEREKFSKYGISERLNLSHQRRDKRHAEKGNGFKTNVMFNLDQAAPTLVARYYKDGKDCLIPDPKNRKPPRMLTPKECAILQTFPDNFWIHPSKSVAYKQFGNAVTVEVARQVSKSLVKYLNK